MILTTEFETLTRLVREAKIDDQKAILAAEEARKEALRVNKVLTERLSVLNQWVAEQINAATATKEIDA